MHKYTYIYIYIYEYIYIYIYILPIDCYWWMHGEWPSASAEPLPPLSIFGLPLPRSASSPSAPLLLASRAPVPSLEEGSMGNRQTIRHIFDPSLVQNVGKHFKKIAVTYTTCLIHRFFKFGIDGKHDLKKARPIFEAWAQIWSCFVNMHKQCYKYDM